MRSLLITCFFLWLLMFTDIISLAQNSETPTIKSDSLIIVNMDPEKGFYHNYILFIPKGTPLN